MPGKLYTNHRNTERRSNERRSNERRLNLDPYYNEDNQSSGLIDVLLNKIDQQSSPSDAHKGDQLTFTIPQILTGFIAIITISGSVLAAWVNITNQITTQKVGTDLIIAQIQKDLTAQQVFNKEISSKMDNVVIQLQGSMDKLGNRIEDLDSTVGQLYNRTIVPKKQ